MKRQCHIVPILFQPHNQNILLGTTQSLFWLNFLHTYICTVSFSYCDSSRNPFLPFHRSFNRITEVNISDALAFIVNFLLCEKIFKSRLFHAIYSNQSYLRRYFGQCQVQSLSADYHCAHFGRVPKIFKRGTKRGPDLSKKGI